jgi:hypothetical protein
MAMGYGGYGLWAMAYGPMAGYGLKPTMGVYGRLWSYGDNENSLFSMSFVRGDSERGFGLGVPKRFVGGGPGEGLVKRSRSVRSGVLSLCSGGGVGPEGGGGKATWPTWFRGWAYTCAWSKRPRPPSSWW